MQISKEKLYFENLDALRFFSFLLVFLYHSFATEVIKVKSNSVYKFVNEVLVYNGNLGVNFFFVLSGFLITYLLIIEKNKFGKINVVNFYMRRVLRIWPLFYFCVFFGFVIFPVLKTAFGQVSNESANVWYYMFFVNNFDFINKGVPDSSVLAVLWSIAVEEQFYLCWPLLLAFVKIDKYWVLFLVLWVVSLTFRYTHPQFIMHELHTLSCISDMVVGGFGAWLIHQSSAFKMQIENLSKYTLAAVYFLIAVILIFHDQIFNGSLILKTLERSTIAILFCTVILEQCYCKNSLFKLSNLKSVTKLGTITYGLYCYQFIGILTALKITGLLKWNQQVWQVLGLETVLSLAITIIIAHFSYKWIETPILALKNKFTR